MLRTTANATLLYIATLYQIAVVSEIVFCIGRLNVSCESDHSRAFQSINSPILFRRTRRYKRDFITVHLETWKRQKHE